jgi:hypothetical protein
MANIVSTWEARVGGSETVRLQIERLRCRVQMSAASAFAAGGATLLIFLCGAGNCSAQGAIAVLNTGAGQSLTTEVRTVFVSSNLAQPRLEFDFGFATAESLSSGTFLDSFTVTIQDLNQQSTAVYLTADASGTVLAPPTPGTVVISASTISTIGRLYPSLQPPLPNQSAFHVSALIPVPFRGGDMNVFFDLFDNLNPQASQGWFSDPEVAAVPEPQTWSLVLLGLGIVWELKRIKK